ncbi:glycosyltransferase [Tundrisphaera lichenicola]|uniref:glycosyltransferase n=1 Tax=Tundrisphaera lichenicola TaxID=2029860 RepID=UPI003EB8FC94
MPEGTRTDIVPTFAERATIAVAIPCYNEAAAVEAVVEAWREALPEAEIVVFDNNSNDGTGAIARRLGVRVVEVREPGKGHAVRAIFEDLADRDAVILVDGDGTYPADAAPALLAPVLEGRAEMVVGARRPVAELGAMSPVRGLGNLLIGWAFRVLIGPGTRDLLSGYRVFSREFLRVVEPRSSGFEIEAELSGQAVARRLRVVEVPVSYHPRIAGTTSKLHAFRDGWRILMAILGQGLRFRPWRPLLVLSAVLATTGLAVGSWSIGLAAVILAVVAVASMGWIATRPRF